MISRSMLLRMRNVSDKRYRENQNTYYTFSDPPAAICAMYEIMLKNIVVPDRPQRTIWRMRFTCLITKATDTHSEYVIFKVSARQQWLRCINGRTWILHPHFPNFLTYLDEIRYRSPHNVADQI